MKFIFSTIAFLFFVCCSGHAQALTSGTTTVGSITAGGTSSQSLTGSAGQGIIMTAYATYGVHFDVYKPDGTLLGTGANGYSATLPVSGTYAVVLSATNTSVSGPYNLYYVRGAGGVSNGALTSGQTYNGNLAINGLESFQLTGTTGQVVRLNTSAAYGMNIYLYAPDGSYYTGSANSFSVALPSTGTYTVVLEATNISVSGPYSLYYVIGGGSVSNGALTSGQTYNGNLLANGLESFQLTGIAGQGLQLSLAASYGMNIYVYKPDGSYGTNGANGLNYNLPSTGTYTVVLYATNLSSSGAYKFYYVRGASSVSNGNLINASTRSDNLPVNGLVSYKFTGVASNTFAVSAASSYTYVIYIYKPDGTLWTSGSSLSGTLPVAGDYTIIFEGNNISTTGPFTITLTTTQAIPAASVPSKVGTNENICPINSTNTSPKTTFANPINFDVGFKTQTETDYDADGLTFSRIYRSDNSWTDNTIGYYWRHNYARSLVVTGTTAAITDGTGATTHYTLSGSNWVPDDPSTTAVFKTVGTTYTYMLPDNTVEKYDANKRLIRIEYMGGGALNLTYNGSAQLSTVTNENGRQLSLTYVSGRVDTLVTPDGSFHYAYDSNTNLKTVTKPDTHTITYFYENVTYVHALTGITDEKGIRFATFGFDTSGKASYTEHAGAVEHNTAVYNANGTSTTTNPLTKNTIYNFVNIQGVRKIIQVDGQASTNCVASNRYYNYDDKGRLIGKTDWENNITRYQYDARGNITQIILGANTVDQQIKNITYDPTFNLPDIITETGKKTDYNYDTYGRTSSVTVTDTTTAETRTTTYTYWPNGTDPNGNIILGRLKQIDGPRTDVTDTTNFAYNANYNLTTITNALSQVTQIIARDPAGRPTTIRDANNIDTVLTYDSNGWLKTSTRASGTALAALTQYDYDFDGNLTKVTLPNNVFVIYSYDNAKRLTGVKDALNNTITYTLDNAGNITQEDIKDASAVLKYTHKQVFDELSRILHSIGAATTPQTDTSAYDKNSNLKTYTDPKTNVTGYGYDALQRLVTTTDQLTGVVTQGYDTRDDLISVKDQRNHSTTYTYNAFGDVTSETSPDRGLTSYVLDKAGNVTQKTDARSVITNYSYDAINRLKTVVYPSQTALNATLTYDATTNCGTPYKGHLCSVTDSAGTILYQYDSLGRMTQETDTRGGVNLVTQYGYDLAGTLTSLTLPSTRTVGYTLNANGRVTGVTAKVSGTVTTLASSGAYLPFGPMTALTYGNGKVLAAAFDKDYNPISRSVAGIYTSAYTVDPDSNITGIGTGTYGYDALNRLNAENIGTATSYTYDLTDNRLTKLVGSTTTTTTVPSTSNKISAVGAAAYTYDAAGNIQSDGINTYTFDAANRLTPVKVGATTVGTYTYDYLGRRAKKVAGSTTTLYVYGPNGELYGEYTSAGALVKEYIYLNDTPLAQIAAGSPETLTYLHTDHLGTPRYATNTSGTQVWSWPLDAFGISTPTGTVTVNLRFPGQYYDAESGIFYNWNRYYNPSIGRYISPDLIGIDGGLNLYSYVGQSPVMGADTTGLQPNSDYISIEEMNAEIGPGSLLPALIMLPSTLTAEAINGIRAINALDNSIPNTKPMDSVQGGQCPAPGDEILTASEVAQWAKEQGFTPQQSAEGPLKFYDQNGIARITIKKGSVRTPGSDYSHIELRNANGQRINLQGELVTRRSLGNHTPIKWDW